MPCQTDTSAPRHAGTLANGKASGMAAEALSAITPYTRSLPARACWMTIDSGSTARSSWLPLRSLTICTPVRYGTWTMSTPPRCLSNSPPRCSEVPTPELA